MTKQLARLLSQDSSPFFRDLEGFVNVAFPDFLFSDFHDVVHSQGYPITNIYVNDKKEIKIEITVTGMSKDDIKLEAEDDGIIVRGEVQDQENMDTSWRLIDGKIKKNSFEKRIKLSNKLDYMKAQAEVKDGLLTINIPQKEKFATKQITIK